ncbi:MAG: 4Fe-4S dicluster domain-containing protein [Thermodesulfobacteriota bacterium]
MKGRIEIQKERCKGCGLCIAVCPKQRIEISSDLNTKGYYPARFCEEDVEAPAERSCTGCALCAVTCPDLAIEVYRHTKDESSTEDSETDDTEIKEG